MLEFKFKRLSGPRYYKGFIHFARIKENILEICMEKELIDINCILKISIVSERHHRSLTWGYDHNWFIETSDRKIHLVNNYSCVRSDLKHLITELQRMNPSILLDDNSMMFMEHKVFDRTTRKSMLVADKFASFRNPVLDKVLGLFSVLILIGLVTGISYLLKDLDINLFSIDSETRIFLLVLGSIPLALVPVNELISPFVGAYLGRRASLISLLLGILCLLFAI